MTTHPTTPPPDHKAVNQWMLANGWEWLMDDDQEEKWFKLIGNEVETVSQDLAAEMYRMADRRVEEAEKAYGGCHNCYGKGYATVNSRWAGSDEWTGERFAGGNANDMKFCTCDRGKQLKHLVERRAAHSSRKEPDETE